MALLQESLELVFILQPPMRNDPSLLDVALGDGRFIHSAGGRGVLIEKCTAEKYASTFVGAVRLSPNADLGIESA